MWEAENDLGRSGRQVDAQPPALAHLRDVGRLLNSQPAGMQPDQSRAAGWAPLGPRRQAQSSEHRSQQLRRRRPPPRSLRHPAPLSGVIT